MCTLGFNPRSSVKCFFSHAATYFKLWWFMYINQTGACSHFLFTGVWFKSYQKPIYFVKKKKKNAISRRTDPGI